MTLVRLKCNIILLLLILSTPFLFSCGSWSNRVPKFTFLRSSPSSSDPALVKMIGMMPIRDMTDYQAAMTMAPLATSLSDALSSSCPKTKFVSVDDPSAPDFLSDPPLNSYGMIDGLKMALMCRQFGLNMVFLASVTDIHYEKESSWYNWLLKNDDLIFLKIRIELYDTHTGTKVFHDTFMEEKHIEPFGAESFTVPEIMLLPEFEIISADITKTISKKICKIINATPWKGFILTADGINGVLSSGSDAGIKTKDVLNVYKNNGSITGFGGLNYLIPGPKIDQVRVTAVSKTRADVVSVSGKNLQADYVVQY